jgi:tetratricopeptide (TPR) repeat protein
VKRRAVLGLGWVLFAGALAGCATTEQARNREEAQLKQESAPAELLAKGDAAARVGDMTRAEQYFVAALKSGGNEKDIVQRLLVACVADQRYPAALEYADNYLRRHPEDAEVRFASASIYAAIGDAARAETELLRVLAEKPAWAEVHYAIATVLREKGSSPLEADRHYREYLRLSPTGTYAEAARGYLLKTVP